MLTGIFDTHAHYYDEAFDPDRDAVLSLLPEHGVELVVCPGCDLTSSQSSIDLAEKYDFLYAAVGIHPENLQDVSLLDIDKVKILCAHPKVVAVGEIGLDYHWVKEPEQRSFSKMVFDTQLSLSEELDMPVIVHDRDAHKDCMDLVRSHPEARGVFHCCAVSLEDAKRLIDWGWMLSFTGNITFPKVHRALEIIQWMPLDRLMLETDAPYMAPEPFRGSRSDSSMIPFSAKVIADCRSNISAQQVLNMTLQNGKSFFRLEA